MRLTVAIVSNLRGDVILAAKPLVTTPRAGVRAVRRIRLSVTCLRGCCSLHLPWALCVKDALINLPSQLSPGAGSGLLALSERQISSLHLHLVGQCQSLSTFVGGWDEYPC